MAEYKYTATNADGVIVSNTVLAENEEEVEIQLHKENLQLVNLRLIPEARESSLSGLLHRVNNTDKAQFLEYFASMLESGLSINDVLQAFYEDLDKPDLRKFVKETQYSLRNGKSLSECFAAYPKLFPELYVGMVKVGEASGTLAQSLRQLATQLKKSNELTGKVRNAMIYPIILVVALTAVITILVIVVFPKLEDFFSSSNLELPALTQFVISISRFATNYWYIIIGGIALLVFTYKQMMKEKRFRIMRSKLMLKIPIFGSLNRTVNVALFARTFGSLLSTGVNILESADVVKATLSNDVYKDIMDDIRQDISVGNTLADSMKKHPENFSPFEIRVLSISDRTGEVAEGLNNVAEFYEQKVYGLLSGLSSAIEPVLLLSMGGIVVAIALAVITPIYQLLSSVNAGV